MAVINVIIWLWKLMSGWKTYSGGVLAIVVGLYHFFTGSNPFMGLLVAIGGWVLVGLRDLAAKALRALAEPNALPALLRSLADLVEAKSQVKSTS